MKDPKEKEVAPAPKEKEPEANVLPVAESEEGGGTNPPIGGRPDHP